MAKINAGIFTFFMSNLNPKTVDLHQKVVAKRNPLGYPHHHVHTPMEHGASMDMIWTMNGQPVATFRGQNIPKRFDYDIIMFLDVDCIPLNDEAIDFYITKAAQGIVIGNAQRSNHIQNNQHVFAAPSAVAMSVDTFATIGFPSARPTNRGDVGEEYTYAAEKTGITTTFLILPMGFEEAPAECPNWPLADGMPVYGRGTTFGFESTSSNPNLNFVKPLFWHQFQSFHPGQQEKFWAKCEAILTPPAITANIA